ncbi:hypothetical protein AOQ88_00230 [Candidatus Riesia sp. GBBU]|nr:hypothetical protein AOQ88_00230 [Candidatus Riesia sp. GBBU]
MSFKTGLNFMTANGHVFFSISSLLFFSRLFCTNEIIHGDLLHVISGVLIGSLIPDIDHPNSFFGRLFKFVSTFLSRVFGHRKFTHSLLGLIFFVLFFSRFIIISNNYNDFFYSFLIGYSSHLIGDMLTANGIPLFWPLKISFCFPILRKDYKKKKEYSISIFLILLSMLAQKDSLIFIRMIFHSISTFLYLK